MLATALIADASSVDLREDNFSKDIGYSYWFIPYLAFPHDSWGLAFQLLYLLQQLISIETVHISE